MFELKLFYDHGVKFCQMIMEKNGGYENSFFYPLLASLQPTLGYYEGGTITHPMDSTELVHFQLERHWEHFSEVACLSQGLLRLEQETLCRPKVTFYSHLKLSGNQ